MAMDTIGVRFSGEEKDWVNAFARVNGISFSEQIRTWINERIEDELDAKELAEAVKNDDGKRFSFDEVLTELGDSL